MTPQTNRQKTLKFSHAKYVYNFSSPKGQIPLTKPQKIKPPLPILYPLGFGGTSLQHIFANSGICFINNMQL